MKPKTAKEIRWTRPGKMTHEEFIAGIREAEHGQFSSFEAHKERMTDWFEDVILKKSK